MATNAYGHDFWIGQIWNSKDSRELWRYITIQDLKNGKAKCHRLTLPLSEKKMEKRHSMISLKTLAARWRAIPEREMRELCERQSEPESGK